MSAEESAKAGKRGLWAGTFEMPDQYRHDGEVRPEPRRPVRTGRAPRTQSVSARPSGGCVIKGNRGSHGWIYRLPGMPYYNQTVTEEMFCSEAEAQASGYRRARVR